MPSPYQSIALIAFTVIAASLTACGGSSTGDNEGETKASLSDSARFDKSVRKKGCDILTAELAGATFGVPANVLNQTKFMGCMYNWTNETERLDAGLSMLQAHASEAMAAEWFANSTRSKTAEEMKAEMERIAEQADAQMDRQLEGKDGIDPDAAKSMAKKILVMAGTKAVVFEDVAGVGDEARIDGAGTLHVRVDNLTFNVSAYKGAVNPPLDINGMGIKEMLNASKEHEAKWAKTTAPQRKQDGSTLAKAIVAAL